MTERDEDRTWRIELGDEVIYRGKRWWLDDERLIGREGQGELRYDEFDIDELEPA